MAQGLLSRAARFAVSIVLVLAMSIPIPAATGGSAPFAASGGSAPSAAATSAIAYVPNQGQWPAHVRYQARAGEQTWWFADDSVWVVAGDQALRLSFSNRPFLDWQASEPHNTRVSYFLGADPAGWASRLPAYGRLALPGEPDLAALLATARVEGAERTYTDAAGRLVADTARGPVRLALAAAAAAAHDTPRPAGAPPAAPNTEALVYSTFLGGEREDHGHRIAVDANGAVYVVGYTMSQRFPTTPGALQTQCGGCPLAMTDAFVAKLSPDGTSLVYATFLGGNWYECYDTYFCDIAVDATGAAYVAGSTGSDDFPTTAGAYEPDFLGGTDGFVAKLSPDGTSLVYATFIGTDQGEDVRGVDVDATGAAYLVGRTIADDFPVSENAYQSVHGGGYDMYVAKLNPAGDTLEYATFLGGRFDECMRWGLVTIQCAIYVDSATGTAYVTGNSTSPDYPVTPGAYQTQIGSNFYCFNGLCSDVVVTHLSADGSQAHFSTYIGGGEEEYGHDLVVDFSGVYVAGATLSPDYPVTAGAFQTAFAGQADAVISKLSPDGTELVYSTFLGGYEPSCLNCFEAAYAIGVDPGGQVFVAGHAGAADFPVTAGALQPYCGGPLFECADGFLARLSRDGSTLLYSTFLGRGYWDEAGGLALPHVLDPHRPRVYVTGFTDSVDFPVTTGAFQTTHGGMRDAFILTLDVGAPHWLLLPVTMWGQ